MRLAVGALLALAIGACVDPFGNLPAGEQIDGIVVGRQVDCGVTSCTRVIGCAAIEEFDTEAPGGIAATKVFDAPDRLRDGTLIARSGGFQTVVFEMEDGGQRAVTVYLMGMCMTGAGG